MLLITPKEVSGLDKSRKEIHADIINEAGIRGKDFAVCIIDDGIDYTHPNLGGCNFTTNINDGSCGRVIGGYDFGDNDNNPIPSELLHHGTHVAGIVSSDDDKYLGIAPESKIIAIKVEKDNGSAGFDTKEAYFDFGFTNIEKGLQWCINNATKYRIAVISMSVGLPNATSGLNENCTDYYHLQDEINNAVSNGISVIVASGNGEFIDGLYYPSCLPNVTSVGSYSSWKRISEFSNRGENLDLVAPGEKIRSTKEGGGFSNIFNDIGFGFWTSGTSFSAPHVTGAVLLMKQFDPALKPYEIEDIFKKTGDDIFDPKTFLRYKGINLQKAFQLDWPTYQHDNRRTGFTLLKGDMQNSKDVEQLDFLFLVGGNEDLFSRSVVSDMDNDGDLETVFFSVYGTPEHPEGWLFVIETDKEGKILRENKIGELFVGDAANGPPVVANTDGDAEKEIVVGLANGTVSL
ncbi:S8 family serine peptidase, partial [Candidatus Woesearchaeota archaeon]|nr:S8 family serine peptidase [Candidatus Woesearchaeota archaeon]